MDITSGLEKVAGDAAASVITAKAEDTLTKAASVAVNTKDPHNKVWLRILAGLVAVLVLAGIAFGCYYLYTQSQKAQLDQNVKALNGTVADLQSQAAIMKQNTQDLLNEQQRIAGLTSKLTTQMSATRQAAVKETQAVQNYDIQDIGAQNPDQVQSWADDQLNTQFTSIQQASQHDAPTP